MRKLVCVFAVLHIAAVTPICAQNNEMLLVKGGSFQMGDAESKDVPVHTVVVSDFYMSQNKVTIEEWMNEMGVYPASGDEDYYKLRAPSSQWSITAVRNVTWYDAIFYCNRRSAAEGLTPCYASNGSKDVITKARTIRMEFQNVTCDWNADGYRLPTEAEWEYAMRNDSRFFDMYKDTAGGKGLGGGFEWCWDWKNSNYYSNSTNSVNPHGPDYGERISNPGLSGGQVPCRVVRGGDWHPVVGAMNPADYDTLVGPFSASFRVVRNAR